MVPVGLSSPLYSVHWLSIVLYYNLVASPKQNASQHAIYTIAIVQSTMPEYSVVGFQMREFGSNFLWFCYKIVSTIIASPFFSDQLMV